MAQNSQSIDILIKTKPSSESRKNVINILREFTKKKRKTKKRNKKRRET